MSIKIVKDTISKRELEEMSKELFGDYVKAVVDIERGIAAFGGGMHADEEAELLEQSSRQEDLWGINLYPKRAKNEWIVFDSLINIRPSQNNRSRRVENEEIQEKISEVINKLVAD